MTPGRNFDTVFTAMNKTKSKKVSRKDRLWMDYVQTMTEHGFRQVVIDTGSDRPDIVAWRRVAKQVALRQARDEAWRRAQIAG